MFDFTRLARGLAFTFLGYFVGFPVLAVATAILVGGFHLHGFDGLLAWWQWPVSCVFPVLSAILAVDFFHRLRAGELTTTQVTGHRASALFLTAGAGFGALRHWEPLAVCAICFLLLLLPAKKRAAPSTWEG